MQAELQREYFVGLDLGLRRDPSAVAVVERVVRNTGEYDRVQLCHVMETLYVVREARRFPLETPYVEIPLEVRRVMQGLTAGISKTLTVDATGVGAPVVELLKKADLGCRLKPVVITGGEAVGKLSAEVKRAYPDIPWQDIKDFRNLLAHEYFGVDLEIVWNTIHNDLPMLIDAVQEIVREA